MVNPIALKIRAKKLGVLIRDARIATGKSLKECAEAIGITNSRMSAYERGEKSPSLPELEALAFYLGVPTRHFWGKESRTDDSEQRVESINLERLIALRCRIVGALLRKARLDVDMSMKDLAVSVGITANRLKTYEIGAQPVPLPELEGMASQLDLSIDYFRDKEGPVGKWDIQQRSIQRFLDLPADLQEFVTKPVNVPYIELAQRLSGMSVDQLRAVAEGLLEITL
jgi:transcriptional regulator with XRE-family HTH domain